MTNEDVIDLYDRVGLKYGSWWCWSPKHGDLAFSTQRWPYRGGGASVQ